MTAQLLQMERRMSEAADDGRRRHEAAVAEQRERMEEQSRQRLQGLLRAAVTRWRRGLLSRGWRRWAHAALEAAARAEIAHGPWESTKYKS